MPRKKPSFVLLERGSRGGLTRESTALAKQLAPNGFQFKRVSRSDDVVLRQLQDVLPNNIILPRTNPFVVLKLTPVSSASGGSICDCKCGKSGNCGGSGGGGGLI